MVKYILFCLLATLAFGATNAKKAAPAAELPAEDFLLKAVSYPDSAAFIAMYDVDCEVVYKGKAYSVSGDSYCNNLMEWECVDFKTGHYVRISPIGYTRFNLGFGEIVLLP